MHGVAGKAAGCCHLASGGNPCPAQELDPGGGEDSCGDDDGDGGAEMEKAADAADTSVLFFSAGANF